jgi:hypothetical protein
MSGFTMLNIKPLPDNNRLKGKDNWAPWLMQMKAMLCCMKALPIAEGLSKCPPTTSKAEGDSKESSNKDAVDAWEDLDAEGLCLVQLCIHPSILWCIQGAMTL